MQQKESDSFNMSIQNADILQSDRQVQPNPQGQSIMQGQWNAQGQPITYGQSTVQAQNNTYGQLNVSGQKKNQGQSAAPGQPNMPGQPMMPVQAVGLPPQIQVKPLPPKRKSMQENFPFFGMASLLYALFYTICLYQNTSGITAPFFTAGTIIYFFLCLKKMKVAWKKDVIFYLVGIELVGLNLCLTKDSILIAFDYIAIILLVISGLLHVIYDDRHWEFGKYFSAIMETVFGSIGFLFQCFGDLGEFRKWNKAKQTKENADVKKDSVGKYVLIGIVCCLPILVIVLLLLASADAMFAELINHLFIDIDIDEDLVGICFMFVMVFICSYALLSKCALENISRKVNKSPSYNAIIAITMNVMLAVVYFVFCMIQLKFLFLGENMGLPEGYTYSSYARNGFFQLLFVCLINMILVLFFIYKFQENRILKGVLTFITACTYIMIASSALRMKLYIEVYQLSYLRLLVLWGLCVIFLMMTGILVYIYRKSFPLFRYGVAVVTVLYLALAFARPEYVIAGYNLNDSFLEDWKENPDASEIDFRYLSELSSDAAPVIANAINRVQDERFTNRFSGSFSRVAYEEEETSWRKFNVSQYVAAKAYENIWQ